ncbi:MAG: UDP-glucose dehydrogenase family protein [Pontimonas sp.]
MKISVIGCGYLGAVHAAGMAKIGHEVVGIDVDQAKVDSLNAARAPFFEPGFDELLSEVSDSLSFSTDMSALSDATVHFLAVGTPQSESGAADMTYVNDAVTKLTAHLKPGDVVVGKSTVPVGTAQRLSEMIRSTGAKLMWNPEFLREGFAVQDTLAPDRLVYGIAEGDDELVDVLDEVYRPLIERETPRLVMDYATAELVKVAANSFLATKISFINAMAEIADVVGADVTQLADAIGHDSRIGRRFLNAGIGFGGGCLPKDIRGFMKRAEELGVGQAVAFLDDVDQVNLRRRRRVEDILVEELGPLQGKTIAVWGLAFKPDSDDIRDSPALDIAEGIARAGAHVHAFDPEAMGPAERRIGSSGLSGSFTLSASAADALEGADAVVVATEWAEFRNFDPSSVASRVVVDGRNCLDRDAWKAAGWVYRGMGRR